MPTPNRLKIVLWATVVASMLVIAAVASVEDSPDSAAAATLGTDCWDEYTLTGTTVQRVVRPAGVSQSGCTVPTVCLEGFTVSGTTRNRIYAPHGLPKSFCTPPPPTTLPATTTTAVPVTTIPATSTTTSTTTTVVPTTTTQAPGGQFVETFTGNTGIDHFRKGVYQRNVDFAHFPGFSGGSWSGDHGMPCTAPSYVASGLRPLSWNVNESMAQRVATAFYNCADHMMTSMGDVDGYSVVWFTPNQTFTNISRVCFDVNLTNLGNRQWWEMAVVPVGETELFSEVPAADLPAKGPQTDVLTFNSINNTRKLAFNGSAIGGEYDAGTDKATRYQNCATDNGNNTITVTQARSTGAVSSTLSGSFPNGPATVMFKDHKYTPDKAERAFQRPAYTWHWDNIVVE